MASRKLTRGGLTRETGLSPNIVYNFLSGKSTYLSQPTLERLSEFYNVPISLLTGTDGAPPHHELHEPVAAMTASPAARLPSGLVALPVKGTVMGPGVWTETLLSTGGAQAEISLQIPSLYANKAFAVRISPMARSSALPPGAFLGCVAIKDYLQKPQDGDLVLAAQRNRMGLFECSVREYRIEDGKHHLIADAASKRQADRVELKSPLADPAALGHQDMFMHAMVLSYAANLPASSR